MIRKYIPYLTAFFLMFMLFSFQLIKTQLRVTVMDDLGNLREGASVALYNSVEDMTNHKVVYGPVITNAKGRASFMDVSIGPYFIEVLDGDYSNDFTGQVTDTLKEGKINKVNIIITE